MKQTFFISKCRNVPNSLKEHLWEETGQGGGKVVFPWFFGNWERSNLFQASPELCGRTRKGISIFRLVSHLCLKLTCLSVLWSVPLAQARQPQVAKAERTTTPQVPPGREGSCVAARAGKSKPSCDDHRATLPTPPASPVT